MGTGNGTVGLTRGGVPSSLPLPLSPSPNLSLDGVRLAPPRCPHAAHREYTMAVESATTWKALVDKHGAKKEI